MGVVYLAQRPEAGTQRRDQGAVRRRRRRTHARTRRFEQEARAASALNHPNVCVVYALGETAGRPALHRDGVRRGADAAAPPADAAAHAATALDIAIQIAAGVGAAHAIGIVHRDLKPENVIVRQRRPREGARLRPRQAGIGRVAEPTEATRTLVQTDAGVVMGTFTYMAPEQARGQDVDARADIWALGVILYELVSGPAPFTGDTRSDVLVAILEREPAPLDR